MVKRFQSASAGLKLLFSLLVLCFLARMVVVLLSVDGAHQELLSKFDQTVGFSSTNVGWELIWTWLTYSFFHAEVSHFIVNAALVILLIFWTDSYFNLTKALLFWSVGAFGGLLFFLLKSEPFALIGASAAISALWTGWLFDTLILSGKRTKFVWWGLVLFLCLGSVDVLNFEQRNLSLLAHAGGGIAGISLALLNRYFEMNMNWLSRLFSKFRSAPNLKVKRSNARFQTDEEFNAERKLKEDYLNAVLDKISRSGFESLSNKERAFLEEQKLK